MFLTKIIRFSFEILRFSMELLGNSKNSNIRREIPSISIFMIWNTMYFDQNTKFCRGKQMTGFYMRRNIGLKRVKGLH